MDKTPQKIRIGSRGSPLALVQTGMVREALSVVAPEIEVEVVVIRTSGDWSPAEGEKRLEAQAGGKAAFAKEIEEALLAGQIDCAVHSMKDMETFLPEGLAIPFMLPREDVRDCLLFRQGMRDTKSIDDLPEGATVGTASVRRGAFLLNVRPDLKIVPLRGNVHTRIEKVRSGQVDATLLAMAGLKRLGLEGEADVILAPEKMLPCAGQGAVGVEILACNINDLAVFSQLNCQATLLCVSAERAALAVLDGSCHTPIGALAQIVEGNKMALNVKIAALDGSEIYGHQMTKDVLSIENALEFGKEVGGVLKSKVPATLLSQRISE